MFNPLFDIDFYKADHRRQYPAGTTKVYSNLTPRSDKLKCIPDDIWTGKVTFFGLQYFIKEYLQNQWDTQFFSQNLNYILDEYKDIMDNALGKDAIPLDHIVDLHKLGYLPIEIKALPEGTNVPIGVPVLTIENTHPNFFWLTNYLETVLSCYLWKPITSATIARHYRLYLDKMAKQTGNEDFVDFQGHDFSFRGMSSVMDAAASGAGHLLSFKGTDTIPAILLLKKYYEASGFIAGSVPATEHSVMCMGGKETEVETIDRLLDLYPTGIVSVVSDTWNLWDVLTKYAVQLKDKIMNRNGKIVFRPDSGNPVKIICGDKSLPQDNPAHWGCMQLLWKEFGGTINNKGYKELDSHIGLIYGDSITFDRAKQICEGLEQMGFATTNMVFGIGSYTYQYVTRDTFGFAVKSTYGEINGVGQEIFKNPITDNGVKKSAKGKIAVVNKNGLKLMDQVQSNVDEDLLRTVFKNGCLLNATTLEEIRNRVQSYES